MCRLLLFAEGDALELQRGDALYLQRGMLSSCSGGCSLAAVGWLLHAVASPVAERGLLAPRLQLLPHAGSAVAAHGLHCSVGYGIFQDEGSNLFPLHRQADSRTRAHQVSLFCF